MDVPCPPPLPATNTMFSDSSSSSSSSPKLKYALNFNREDTGKNFVGHLRGALRRKGFDDDEVEISPNLWKATVCCIVVLTENYASCSSCLTALSIIIECMGTSGKVLPIFFHVDPSDVRNLRGSYGDPFKKYEKDHNSEIVQSWRNALKTVGNLPGWHVTKDTKDEAIFIREFIKQISRKLEVASLDISQDLFGINSRVEKFESSTVAPSSDTVRFIGICGGGGIGKTTLAKVYYNQNFYKFDGSSFLANVRETCEKRNTGLVSLQAQLLSDVLKDNNIKIDNVDRGVDMIRRRLSHKKVLIVLDDVDKSAQLEALAYQEDWFGPGSITIVTTRDEGMLRANGISAIYKAEILSFSEALQLFSRKAFKTTNPPEDYKEVCEQVVEYTKGLPLTLAVLGSFFGGKRSINDVENALNKLSVYQNKEISQVLKVSFEDLEEIDQEIFLDIACFFNEYSKYQVEEILDSCGFSQMEYRISNLIEKSLLSIDQNNHLHMHDLLQEMGKEIVRGQSPNQPGRQSRIWNANDLYHVLENKTGTEKVEAIVTSVDRSHKLTSFETISQMKNLRMLVILDPDFLYRNDSVTPVLEYLPNNLRLLQWDTFPYKGFPSSFRPYELVELKLFGSSIEKLWDKHATPLCNLKIINLSDSWNLTKFEDFTVVPNLERLILEGCVKLLEIHDSITRLAKLTILNLASCTSLNKLPKSIKGVNSLEILNLYDCRELLELPEDCGNLKSLKEVDVRESRISHLPSSIFLIEKLKVLCDEEVANLSARESIINPPIGRCFLPDNLRIVTKLDLSDCNLLDEAFPEHFGNLVSLEELNLSKNPFSALPPHVKGLLKLTYLNLMYCKSLTHLSPDQLPSGLETLRIDYCTSLNTLLDPLEPCHFQCSIYCVDCTGLVKRRGGEKTALALLKGYIQNSTLLIRPFDIVIPGSGISAWFTRQSLGPSVSIKLDGNNRCAGIALSVCFGAKSSDVELSCVMRIRGENKKCKLVTKKIYRRSSNHIWLSYLPRGFFLECLQNGCYGLHFSFYADESNNSCCGPCGVRLVYNEDIEELNQITLQNCNKSPEDQAQDCEHYSCSKRDDLELIGRHEGHPIQDSYNANMRFDIVAPRIKISSWFSKQSLGPSISTRLHPNLCNRDLTGFALCANFRTNSSSHNMFCDISFKGNILKFSKKDNITKSGSSDRLWLFYLPLNYFPRGWLQNTSGNIEFSFYSSDNSCCGKCALRLVYLRDKPELNQIISQYGIESHNQEDDHCSHSKRSKNKKAIFGSILVATVVASLVVILRHKSH